MNIRKFKEITLNIETLDNNEVNFRTKDEMINLDTKTIVNDFPGVAFALDNKSRLVAVNNRFCECLEDTRAGLLGKKLSDLNLGIDWDKLSLKETLRTGKPTYGYRNNLFIDYDYQLIYCNLPINLDTGEIGVLVLGIEVIMNSNFKETKIMNFNENTKITDVWIVDDKCCYVDVTDPYNKFKVSSEELIGKKFTNVFPVEYDPLLSEAIEENRLLESMRILNTGKEKIYMQVIAFPLVIDGEVVGGIDILIDLNSKTRIVNQAYQANEIKNTGEMAFRIIHELRNPLQVTKSSAELGSLLAQKENVNSEEIELYFNKIKDKVTEVNSLLNQLLEFSQPDKLVLKEVKIKGLLESLEEFLTKYCSKYKIDFQIEVTEEILKVEGDYELLERALFNISKNAIEALQDYDGDRKIIVKCCKVNNDALISISNTGPTISNDIKDNIFAPFTSTKGINGAGLGLSVAYHIAHNLHEGKLWFKNKEEVGPTFYLSLPTLNNL
ncbi:MULTISPECIES: sensor histidine kinase [unclassified Candidatus Frackibacter]|uniref:sensor histidine kinase n=1 Tax=unclassified Candidatus Frackibacter TaxID=2648818 RepID=UPI000883A6C6|nr:MULTISPECIES: HAMP domain-containing sensor histidine kinase [unclassified Candidatus Frackibacter]SDC59126.1 Signal transduction histidine kinase [Candidatus Frackibacter sp. WG11]SEM42549.1 Signal transduction histidine kinase [Candidatus Frackibacter sp. WG12]SFL85425.1 Signal transduction histidine kinase [Candidatus Frackibacter sp. WG13]